MLQWKSEALGVVIHSRIQRSVFCPHSLNCKQALGLHQLWSITPGERERIDFLPLLQSSFQPISLTLEVTSRHWIFFHLKIGHKVPLSGVRLRWIKNTVVGSVIGAWPMALGCHKETEMTTETWLHLRLPSSVLWELASRSLKVIATFFQITVLNDWDVGSQLRRQLKEHHYIYTVACVFLSLWLLLSCRVLTDVLRCDWGRHCHYPLVDHEAWFNFHSHKASKRLEFGLLFLCPVLLGCPAFPTSYKVSVMVKSWLLI